MSFTISDTEFGKNKKNGLSIIDTGAEKNTLKTNLASTAFPPFEIPNIIISSQGGAEWLGEDRDDAVNRNLTVGNTGRIH